MSKFSHINPDGLATMVDIQQKDATQRKATAQSIVELPAAVLSELLVEGKLQSKKGGVFQTAVLAGIMAAKKQAI